MDGLEVTDRALESRERRLDYRPPLHAARVLAFLAARAIPGVESVGADRYSRVVRSAAGRPVVVEVEPDPSEPVLALRVTGLGDDVSQLAVVVRSVRRLFDLDADPETIDAALSADPALRPLVRSAPGTRLPGTTDGFELVVRAIVGQQVSVAGARTTLGRIAERFGTPLPSAVGPIGRLFPTAEQLAGAPRDAFGMPATRADAIVTVARMVADGAIDLSGRGELEPTLAGLTSIRGVGDWTASYVAMRALGDPDAFPTSDLGVRRGFAALGLADDLASIRERAERWRPWRAYAAMHLWHAEG